MDYPVSDPKVGLHNGKFPDGSADGTIKPSLDPAAWANAVTDEILAVIASGGLAKDEANHSQMASAILAMIAAHGPTVDLTGYAKLTVVQSWTAQQYCSVAALADGATIAWDLSVGQMATVTISANRTLANPTNQVAGTRSELRVTHGAANTTLSFGSAYKGISSMTLSAASGAVDVLTFRSNGTSMELIGISKNVGA
jgi:glycerol-3-phosphate dehydrogenase